MKIDQGKVISENDIEKLAIEKYGDDLHLYAQQREGFCDGYNSALAKIKELENKINDHEINANSLRLSLRETNDELLRQLTKVRTLTKTLTQIANWELPRTGKFFDEDETRPMSYEACYGSNGARDFIKEIAHEAIKQ